MDIKLTPEQQLQLTMLFAQQEILNQIVLDHNAYIQGREKEEPTLDNLKAMLLRIVKSINEKQKAIDTHINQIQADVRSNLN